MARGGAGTLTAEEEALYNELDLIREHTNDSRATNGNAQTNASARAAAAVLLPPSAVRFLPMRVAGATTMTAATMAAAARARREAAASSATHLQYGDQDQYEAQEENMHEGELDELLKGVASPRRN